MVLFNTEGVEGRGGGEEEMTEEGREGTLHPVGVSVHPRGFLYTPGSIDRPKKALSIPCGPHYKSLTIKCVLVRVLNTHWQKKP